MNSPCGKHSRTTCGERSRTTCPERSRRIYGEPKQTIEPFNHEKKL